MSATAVIWHDLECGAYRADLPLWRQLADESAGPVLDVGAGTGRVALDLARRGHRLIALERDAELAAELARRSDGLQIEVLVADACAFELVEQVALCIAPMQTVQLLEDRPAFLRCARAALRPRGILAAALLGEDLQPFELELRPDVADIDGVRYLSAPTALRQSATEVVLERRRTARGPGGEKVTLDVVALARLDPSTLAKEALAIGLVGAGVAEIGPTDAHAGSTVALFELPT